MQRFVPPATPRPVLACSPKCRAWVTIFLPIALLFARRTKRPLDFCQGRELFASAMNDLISVVIPTFNRARCLERAIKSVLAQTHLNRELIVVDDGSTDSTPEMLAAFGNLVQVIKQQNSGPSSA